MKCDRNLQDKFFRASERRLAHPKFYGENKTIEVSM